jgi:hypothetical protein
MIEGSLNCQSIDSIKTSIFDIFNCANSLNLKMALATFFTYSGVIKTMGLKPYFIYLLTPWLNPRAMDEKHFLLNEF